VIVTKVVSNRLNKKDKQILAFLYIVFYLPFEDKQTQPDISYLSWMFVWITQIKIK